jgi:metal-responsive CopG/Arc/MetJ family transcriptional regulator
MKIKTSITLSERALAEVDRLAVRSNRSAVIEAAVLEYAARRRRIARDRRDLRILDEQADALNAEVEDALLYQAEP